MVENNTDRNNTNNLIVALGNIRGARATIGAICLTLSIVGVGCAITTDRVYARTLKAVSGPDDKGRWRFNTPYDAPTGAMESQGCELATFSEPSYRCPDKTVELQDTRTLRAVSGPDDKGRWRFNSPGSDVPSSAMESQGCEYATFDEPSYRCRDEKITVPIKY